MNKYLYNINIKYYEDGENFEYSTFTTASNLAEAIADITNFFREDTLEWLEVNIYDPQPLCVPRELGDKIIEELL